MVYLDTSALVKLVVSEAETLTLRRFLAGSDPARLITSALARAELLRAAGRRADPDVMRKVREVLDAVAAVTITESLLNQAGAVEPPELRTLDAIHLATALELGELEHFVAYDARLLSAARRLDLPAVAPA